MQSLFQKIRNSFGLKTEVEADSVDLLDKAIQEKDELQKAYDTMQAEFDETCDMFNIKIAACDQFIEKGHTESAFNKQVLTERLDKLSNEYLDKALDLNNKLIAKSHEI